MRQRDLDLTSDNAPAPRRRSGPWSRSFLPACLAVYLLLGVAFSLVFPLSQAPDEPAHVQYALFLARERRLPDFYADNAGYESYQPPLYYTLCAAVGKLAMALPAGRGGVEPPASLEATNEQIARRLPHYETVRSGQHDLALAALRQSYRRTAAERRAWLAMRLLTVLLGGVGILLAYRIVFAIFPARPWMAATVAALMATQPMYLHICASVGNEPPTVVAVGLTLLVGVLLLREGPSPARAALLGLALGIGMLVKASATAVLPVAVLALAWAAGRRHQPRPADTPLTDLARRVAALEWKGFLRMLGIALGVAAALAGWWYARSIVLYGSLSHFPANVDKQVSWEIYLARPDMLWRLLSIAVPMTFRNFWAGFAWTNIAVAPWIYWLLLAVCLASLPGLGLLIADARAGRLGWSPLQIRAVWLLTVAAGLLKLALLYYILLVDLGGGSQGRYLFPVFVALGMLWTLGVARLLPERLERLLPFAVAGAMLAFTLWCLFGAIVPFYRILGV